MRALPVIAIFDIGKTNKKIFLFDEHYAIVFEETITLKETTDEDGFPCEDVTGLTEWVTETFHRLLSMREFMIRGINFTAYGASFVHLDIGLQPFLPLYNYLKPYPASLQEGFYKKYGSKSKLSLETASPVLGNLNSGMQLFYLKHKKPELFNAIKWSLHLPQYISFILSKKLCSEITSIGCHTSLWNFKKNAYHRWVKSEGIQKKLPPLCNEEEPGRINFKKKRIIAGNGLHDSSSALVPYLISFNYPFVLISTGTWCISLNPFNYSPLTPGELKDDCLCYLSYSGKPVKASRIFAGNEHEQMTKKLSAHFHKPLNYYSSVEYDAAIISRLKSQKHLIPRTKKLGMVGASVFSARKLSSFANYEQAYHQLIYDIVELQKKSTQLVIKETEVKRIFVDGGFSKNQVYMFLLAAAFNEMEVYAASVSQASAIGAALVLHNHWNKKPLPRNILELKYYSPSSIAV
jgi:sugar (pentulose or hexulose) kinase